MFGPTFNDYYRDLLEKVRKEIMSESDSQILGSNVDELSDYYYGKYALRPIEFDQSNICCEPRKQVRTVPAHQREGSYRYEGDTTWEYESVEISVPFEPNQNIAEIKKFQGGPRFLDGFDEALVYGHNKISYSFNTKWYGGSMDEDRIANEINTKAERLIQTLIQKNNNIDHENFQFLNAIKQLITERKIKLEADKVKIESLIAKIKIPIKQKNLDQETKVRLSPKPFVQKVKPTPKLPEEYVLEEDILNGILNYVDSQCKNFEKTPASYKQLGEEELRDIILSALNGIFEGNATGETFVKKGKTDIHLKIEKGEILIFECKNWAGEKRYLETIDQLTGYVTWRQNYGVLIMFCKNKNFSKILEQIPVIIQKHTQYKSNFKQLGASHFVSNHSFPEDEGKTIKIHHFIFNLFSE